MKFSERWLRKWVNPDIDTASLERRLTMAGLEIESSLAAAVALENVVVGHVLSVARHPDAEKLHVCTVSNGKEDFQVVCGASNVRAGMKVPFAMVGARLGAELKIRKAKLRGVESFGMLCSAAELGMAESADGLLELPESAPAGIDIVEFLELDDRLIEVNLTPNRGDCLSIAGLAREVGTLTHSEVKAPVIDVVAPMITDQLKISLLSPAACPRYLGRVIRKINPDVETPVWMSERLRRCGLRSIDPVVDVTNYVLLELGQPMHAFDLARLEGGITVRQAAADEHLTLLDGKEVELTPDVLVIADQNKPIAMAGIMGGKFTAVGPLTKDIFLESAYFNPMAIAGRARHYGLHTDAGHRYERGVDYNLPLQAMERATALLLSIVGGQAGPVVSAEGVLPATVTILLRRERICRILGASIVDDEVETILTSLGLELQAKDAATWTFAIPSWRHDLNLEVDLIEELARVKGYDTLPVTRPLARLPLMASPESAVGLRKLKHRMVSLGYQEVITYSFVDAELETALGEGDRPVKLANPISQDLAVMRTNLWSGLIRALKYNQNRQANRIRLFEAGLTFILKNSIIEQNIKVGSIAWGARDEEQWAASDRAIDFFDMKGDVQALLGLSLQAEMFEFQPAVHKALQPGQTARILLAGNPVGWIGALHPGIQQGLDIPGKVFLSEIDFSAFQSARIPVVTELSRFPSVRRDLALVVGQAISAAEVLSELRTAAGPDLIELTLFDVYQGQNIENGKKSLALGLTFQHASRTLADDEINPIINSCIKALEAKFNAELR